ncbi:hypothetical protein ACRRTK_000080 [Alexandromys fortis]
MKLATGLWVWGSLLVATGTVQPSASQSAPFFISRAFSGSLSGIASGGARCSGRGRQELGCSGWSAGREPGLAPERACVQWPARHSRTRLGHPGRRAWPWQLERTGPAPRPGARVTGLLR